MSGNKIFIGVPSARDWDQKFGHQMSELMYRAGKKGHDVKLGTFSLSLLPANRELILKTAVKLGVDYLMMIDDDMIFPPDILDLFLSRNKDVVSANAPVKSGKFETVTTDIKTKKPISSIGKKGIEQAYTVSFALSLIRVSAFKDIPAPRFEIKWNPKTEKYRGEDIYFCDKLREAGVEMYVDHTASQYVMHAGKCYHTNRGTIIFAENSGVELQKPKN
nr:hypothetical protein [Nitrosomonas nitrosa]